MKTLVEGQDTYIIYYQHLGCLLAVLFKNLKFYLGNKIFLFTILMFLINNLYLASNILSNIYDLRTQVNCMKENHSYKKLRLVINLKT